MFEGRQYPNDTGIVTLSLSLRSSQETLCLVAAFVAIACGPAREAPATGQATAARSTDQATFGQVAQALTATCGPGVSCPSPSLCTGTTSPNSADWKSTSKGTVYIDVNTSECGLTSTPSYFTALSGSASGHLAKLTVSSIYNPTPTGFRVYVVGGVSDAATAKNENWQLNWQATPQESRAPDRCTGATSPGGWVKYGSNGAYINVDTSACGYNDTPTYVTSLTGIANHHLAIGSSAIYGAGPHGFRVYVSHAHAATIAQYGDVAALANADSWRLNWQAVPANGGQCAGQGKPAWTQVDATSIRTHVAFDPDCQAPEATQVLTSLDGNGGHWTARSPSLVSNRTSTGFDVTLFQSPSLLASKADSDNWRINWITGAVRKPVPPPSSADTLCSGITGPNSPNWKSATNGVVYTDVDTSKCGLRSTPAYFSSLSGDGAGHLAKLTVSSIYNPSPIGFRVYVPGGVSTATSAKNENWQLTWQAAPVGIRTPDRCTGVSNRGAWIKHGSNGAYINVDTSACGYADTPTYFTSLTGSGLHSSAMGSSSIYVPTPTGFQVFVYFGSAATIAQYGDVAALANADNWRLNWQALPVGGTQCAGEGDADWTQVDASSIRTHIEVPEECRNSDVTNVLTSLGGKGGHWTVRSPSLVSNRTNEGFDVTLFGFGSLSAASAKSLDWKISWTAADGRVRRDPDLDSVEFRYQSDFGPLGSTSCWYTGVCDEGYECVPDGPSWKTCRRLVCGDGFVSGTSGAEQCDDGTDGNTGAYGGCNPDCTLGPRCGDLIVQSTEEECDGGPACSSSCRLVAPVCGNSQVDSGEDCDDGNKASGDGCSDACRVERCGNRIKDVGEECDDGNTWERDACFNNCTRHPCGNGVLEPAKGEDCDDGNRTAGDGCDHACFSELCGNGTLEEARGEECDDGGNVAEDGCDRRCHWECGNGAPDKGEECDDGNRTEGDGCTAACRNEYAPPAISFTPSAPGVGTVPVSDRVTDNGSFNLTVPLKVPDGRAGIQPNLALTYNSQGGAGALGVGWSLSGLSSIHRCAKRYFSDGVAEGIVYDDTDNWCFNGRKLILTKALTGTSGIAHYRLEEDDLSRVKIEFPVGGESLAWRELPNGVVEQYYPYLKGRLEAHQNNADDHDKLVIYGFSLLTVTDPLGNSLMVGTERDAAIDGSADGGASRRPRGIYYTHNHRPGLDTLGPTEKTGKRRVEFSYIANPSPSVSYVSGLRFETNTLLAGVQMFAPTADGQPPTLVWDYQFSYSESPDTGRARLQSIVHCTYLTGQKECLTEREFQYSEFAEGPESFRRLRVRVPEMHRDSGFQVFDANGDGRSDLFYLDTTQSGPAYQPRIRLARPTIQGLAEVGAEDFWPADNVLRYWLERYDVFASEVGEYRAVDLDSSGTVELVYGVRGYFDLFSFDNNSSEYLHVRERPPSLAAMYAAANPKGESEDNEAYSSRINLELARATPVFVSADMNGDGRNDIIYALRRSTSFRFGFGVYVVLRDGDGWAPPTIVNLQGRVDFRGAHDLNGDGRAELVYHKDAWVEDCTSDPNSCALPDPGYWHLSLSTDGDLVESYIIPGLSYSVLRPEEGEFFKQSLDVNGDGLSDLVYPEGVELNTGRGFGKLEQKTGWLGKDLVGVEPHLDPPLLTNHVAPADFNGDGRDDYFWSNEDEIRLMRWAGDGWTDMGFSLPHQVSASGNKNTEIHRALKVADHNGDGLADIYTTGEDGDFIVYERKGIRPDLLTRVVGNSSAPYVAVAYGSVADERVHERDSCEAPWGEEDPYCRCDYPRHCVNRGLWVVKNVTREVPNSQKTVSYSYKHGRANMAGGGFLGFEQVVSHDPLTRTTSTRNFNNWDPGDGRFPYAGTSHHAVTYTEMDAAGDSEAYLRVTTDDHSINVKRVLGEMNGCSDAQAVERPECTYYRLEPYTSKRVVEQHPHQRLVHERIPTLGHGKWVTGSQSYWTERDGYGNPGVVEEYTAGPLFSRLTSRAEISYLNSTSPWLVGLQEEVTTTSYGSSSTSSACEEAPRLSETSTTRYHIDEKTGLVDKVFLEPESGKGLTVRYTRDGVGNVTLVETYPFGDDSPKYLRSNATIYDPERLYPRESINGLGHREVTYVHPALGLTWSTFDPNGNETRTGYDGFGRLTQLAAPGASVVGVTRSVESADLVKTVVHAPGLGYSETLTDKFGLAHSELTKGFRGKDILQRSYYDERGRLTARSLPHYAEDPDRLMLFAYDNLDRLIERTNADQTEVKTHYLDAERIVRSFDEDGNKREEEFDYQGRLIEARDYDGSVAAATKYEYTFFDNPARVVDAEGHATEFCYGAALHDSGQIDPSRGKTVHFTNVYGEPEETRAATGNRTYSDYDRLGRLTSQHSTWQENGGDTYTWDVAASGNGKGHKGIGLLARATRGEFWHPHTSISDEFVYDEHSRPWVHTRTRSVQEMVNGTVQARIEDAYESRTLYDSQGRVRKLVYPAVEGRERFYVTNSYDGLGNLESVAGNVGGASPGSSATEQVLWRADKRHANGTIQVATYPRTNSFVERELEPDTLRPSWQQVTVKGVLKQDLNYAYYANGVLESRQDLSIGRLESFATDGLSRLERWHVESRQGSHSETFDYSIGGRINSVTDQDGVETTYTYGGNGAGPYAVSGVRRDGDSQAAYWYNKAGQQIRAELPSGERSITWKAFGLPAAVSMPSSGSFLSYDAFHARAMKFDHLEGTRTSYVGKHFEHRVLGIDEPSPTEETFVFHVFADGEQVSQITYDSLSKVENATYFYPDSLGSLSLVSDGTGALHRNYFSPFGQRVTESGSALEDISSIAADAHNGFTGHEHDDEFGLINMNGRMYDPVIRQFISPDPYVTDPFNSRDWNPYAYVRNSPLNLTDPSGFQSEGGGLGELCILGEDVSYYPGACGGGAGPAATPDGSSADPGGSTLTGGTSTDGSTQAAGVDPFWGSAEGNLEAMNDPAITSTQGGTVAGEATRGFAPEMLGPYTMGQISGDSSYVSGGAGPAQGGAPGRASLHNIWAEPSFRGVDTSATWELGLQIATVFAPTGGAFNFLAKAATWLRGAFGVPKASNVLLRTSKQLASKFKHAADFGVVGNYSKANAAAFSRAIHQHINNPAVHAIHGTYHKAPVTHYLDPSSGLNVISDRAGTFISGWKLNPDQLRNVLTHGGL